MKTITNQSAITRGLTLGFFAGAFLWIVLLMQGAQKARVAPLGEHIKIHVGPFLLTTLSKTKVGEGYRVLFTFENGFLWFFIGCSIIGALLWWLIHTATKTID